MPVVTGDLAACRDAFFAALVARDGTRARRIVEEAVEHGVPVSTVYVEVLQPVLYTVGHEWAEGRMTVAEEHFATALVEQLVGRLASRTRMPPYGGRLAVVACTAGELHALGARMVADFLEADGWEVLHLGASTPCDALISLVEAEAPDLVALSTNAVGRMPDLADVLRSLGEVRPRPLVAVGGQFWTDDTARLAERLGADVVIRDARRLVATLRDAVPPRDD